MGKHKEHEKEDVTNESCTNEFKVKKKKKNKKRKRENLSEAEKPIETEAPPAKKAKSKKMNDAVCETSEKAATLQDITSASHCKKKKKKKKRLMMEGDTDVPHKNKCEPVVPTVNEKGISKSKVKKRKSKCSELSSFSDELENGTADSAKRKSKKKKHANSEIAFSDSSCGNTSVDQQMSRKKNTKKKTCSVENTLNGGSKEVSESSVKDCKKKRKYLDVEIGDSTNVSADVLTTAENDGFGTKKKKKSEKVEDSCQAIPQMNNDGKSTCKDDEIVEGISKKKKNKKKTNDPNKGSQGNDELVEGDCSNHDAAENTKRKAKKDKKKVSSDQNAGSRKNARLSEDESQGEQSAKEKKKKKKKHKNIKTEEPIPKEKEQENAPQTSNFGQWGVSSFEDKDRQKKFLRLLGGFKKAGTDEPGKKKSLFGSLGSLPPSGGSRAMGAEQAQKLNVALEKQYNDALDFKLNHEKGGGLGFTAPPGAGKKFHIETSASKSTKFDDD